MKHYHIVFYQNETDFLSEGRNYEAADPVEAYKIWAEEFPDATFFALYIRERI